MSRPESTLHDAPHFNLLESPLRGTHLIEASAGTGKTYAITALYLRLLLERRLSVNQIVVVTFTQAATEELKTRIRNRIRQALASASGEPSGDPFLSHIAALYGSDRSIRDLEQALRDFDQAAIFTIHGFCRRMLHERAFESGSLFDTELVPDQEELEREIVDDFWRNHISCASPMFVDYALNIDLTPATLLRLLSYAVVHRQIKVIPGDAPPDTTSEEKRFRDGVEALCRTWPGARESVQSLLLSHRGLNRAVYRPARVNDWVRQMDQLVRTGTQGPFLFDGFEYFTTGRLRASVKKHQAPPQHPLFDLCDDLHRHREKLEAAFQRRLIALKYQLLQYAREELPRRKRKRNIQSFEDLLNNLFEALQSEGGGRLAAAIRSRFKAALIDEFQDTDPVQYTIFRRIFAHKDQTLFLIGDPKQAIYGFRGADLFAYMKASEEVPSRHTLRQNWRSAPGLVSAVNALFSGRPSPFIYRRIPFLPAEPAPGKSSRPLLLDGVMEPPFQFWFLEADPLTEPGKMLAKESARPRISRAVAGETARLLNLAGENRALLGDRPLREADIAVLVRTNREARLVKQDLSALGIPGVLYSTGSLFESPEALETQRVLTAVSGPADESALRGALATDIFGYRGEELEALLNDERRWEALALRFRGYRELWNDRGFMRMFRQFLHREHVLPRLMRLPEGERRSTNILHLSEVLNQQAVEKKYGPADLLKWLSEQREGGKDQPFEHQLRLESDEDAVKIITTHKGKGLEFPVVFCPFTWEGSKVRDPKDPLLFHDDDQRLTLDLGSKDTGKNRTAAEEEILAENLRLLYVALTRAKSRCYFIWGRFNGAQSSAPAYLFHRPDSPDAKSVVEAVENRFRLLDDEAVREDLQPLLEAAPDSIRFTPVPLEAPQPPFRKKAESGPLSSRQFSGSIDRTWGIASFSSLTSGGPSVDVDDRDEGTAVEAEAMAGEPEPPAGIFAFPAGAKAGLFFHDLLENLDLTGHDRNSLEELASRKLARYRFEPQWCDTVCEAVTRVIKNPLQPEGIRLTEIPNEKRLSELEFYFPLRPTRPERIQRIFKRTAGTVYGPDVPERIGNLRFSPTRGYMRGFIDLVFQWKDRFYLVDWKSNHLGNQARNYSPEGLAPVIEENHYILQYTIYTLALDQYLRARLPGYRYDRHFGGVYYIFLRGVNPEIDPECGIYRDRPPASLIEALREALISDQP